MVLVQHGGLTMNSETDKRWINLLWTREGKLSGVEIGGVRAEHS